MGLALRRSIYLEHLEEGAMLFEQRQRCLEDPESELADLAEYERRLDAHLDGLELGTETALALVLEQLGEGEPGVLHVLARLLLRRSDPADLALASSFLALEDELQDARRRALEVALSFELRPAWAPGFASFLGDEELAPSLIHAIGARRIAAGAPMLRERLAEAPDPGTVWALGELRDYASLSSFHQLLGSVSEPRLWSQLALACLKLGDASVPALLRSSPDLSGWSPLAQVLCFEPPLPWLHAQLQTSLGEELLVALALRGDPGSFAELIGLLEHEQHGALAAGALFTITGAPLLDALPEPGPIEDEAEDEDDPDALEPGWWGLSRDPQRWREWLQGEPQRWEVGRRYRLGAALDARACARAAMCCALPLPVREALLDELALCHEQDPKLRASGPARTLLELLSGLASAPPALESPRREP